MLRQLFSAIFQAVTRSPALTPADIAFWTRLGHSPSRAEEIARCFPEYWKQKERPDAERYAKHFLAQELGDIPTDCCDPTGPCYARPQDRNENDPLVWCRVNGYDICSLPEAVTLAVIATRRWRRNARLRPFREKWHKMRRAKYNDQRKRLSYSPTRTPANPLFWRCLGHNPAHARRLARCCPEYWFRQSRCSWRWAVTQTTRTLKQLARRLDSEKHRFYELAETDGYDIKKRDPVHWFLEGANWDEALRKVVHEAFYWPPEGCERLFHVRDMIRKAGRRSELLRDSSIHISGPLLGCQAEYEFLQAKRNRHTARRGDTAKLRPRWGPLEVDTDRMLKTHCCALGPAEEGTDILLRILMHSVPKQRWLVFDAAGSLFPAIKAIRPAQELHLLNPLDVRSSAWNIAADAATPQQAAELVAKLLPTNEHYETMLVEGGRALLAAIIAALNQEAPGKWSLCDFIAAAEPQNLRTVLTATSVTANAYKAFRNDPNAALIASFVRATLQPLKPAAAAWRTAFRKVGIAEWLQSNSALILSNSFHHQHLLAPLNQVLFRLIAARLMEPQAVSPQKTWVFLSDLCRIGRLESLPTLLSQGPATGVTVAVALDDVEILQRHYGTEATGLLARCGNFAFLRIANPATARWAALMLGIAKVQLVHKTEGTLSGKTSCGTTITSADRPLVPPTAFQQLPLPKEGHGPVGYFKNLGRRAYKGEIDRQRFLQNQWLCEPAAAEPALVPCPEEHLQFPQDTAALLAELGFSRVRTPHKRPTRSGTAKKQEKPKRKGRADQDRETTTFDPDDFPRLDVRLE